MTEFTKAQYEHAYPDGIENHYWNLFRKRVVHRLIKCRGTGGRILEIGCGRGIVVDYLRRQGLDCWGVEMAAAPPITAAVAPYLRLGTPAEALDAGFRDSVTTLVLLDVIEHIEDPAAFLCAVLAHYKNAVTILWTVPARRELWSNFDDYYGHFRRYDRRGCLALAADLGLDALAVGYFFHLIYPAIFLATRLRARRATDLNGPQTRLSRWCHAVVARLFELDWWLVPRRVVGSSLYLVAARTPPASGRG
jgi:hypothetical protein